MQEFWPNYSKGIFEDEKNKTDSLIKKILNCFKNDKNDYDLVFIDGRFRVACTLQTILNCKKDTRIMMHDFNDRPHYHNILEFLDIVNTIDTMALFKIKNEVNLERVKEMYENVKMDFS